VLWRCRYYNINKDALFFGGGGEREDKKGREGSEREAMEGSRGKLAPKTMGWVCP